ncbi:MAG: glycosyltransferase family 2 protein, partial [Candidatus Caldatribacteriaceae bacterium]
AGTGFVITHGVLDRIGTGRIFDEESLTEDYKLSLHFAQLGIATHFFLEGVQRVLDNGRVVTEYLATREIFPNTLREAVKQKSRWIYGISFQSFSLWQVLREARFSPIAKYSLYRDWKAKYGNLLPLPGYAIFTYFLLSLFYRLPPVYPRGSLSWWLSVVLTFFMGERQFMRAVALKNVYGWRSAVAGCFIPPLLPIRAVWGNIINFLATLRAWRIALFGFPRSRPRWQKTKHTYLTPQVLARYQRRLGDLLLEKRLVDPQVLLRIVREKKENERLGERLIRAGVISEEDLVECLGEILKVGSLSFDHRSISWDGDKEAIFEVCRQYTVVPLACSKRSLLLASPQPLSLEAIETIKAKLQKEKVLIVLASSQAIEAGLEVLQNTLPRQFPRLGEKLLERGLIQEEHLVEALRVQRFLPLPLGEILCEMGVLWPEDVEEVLKGEEHWQQESV